MEVKERQNNIEIATRGANFVFEAAAGDFVEFLKREDMGALRLSFSELAKSLSRNRILAKGATGWSVDIKAIESQPDRVLDEMHLATQKVVGDILVHDRETRLKDAGFHSIVTRATAMRPLFPDGAVARPVDRLPTSLQLMSLHPLSVADRDVKQFSGADRMGSNMFAAPVLWGDAVTEKRLWDCNELPYILAKTRSGSRREDIVGDYNRVYLNSSKRGLSHAEAVEAGAKSLKVKCRGLEIGPDGTPGWMTGGSLDVMRNLVSDKFGRNESCARWLLETGVGKIEEGNVWGDVFWGKALKDIPRRNIQAGDGRNELGRMIMTTRDDLREALGFSRVFVDRDASAPEAPRRAQGIER